VHGIFVHDTAIRGELSRGNAETVEGSNPNSPRLKEGSNLQGSKGKTRGAFDPLILVI
jgi:hypothetical protein